MHFENVTVYYFSRRQGFTSVPSQGGSTLGMSNRHSWIRQYSLGEFALEQERIHRDMLRDHLKEEKLNSIKLKVSSLYYKPFCTKAGCALKDCLFQTPLDVPANVKTWMGFLVFS